MLTVHRVIRLGSLCSSIMRACPDAICTITDNGWTRVEFEDKAWASIDVNRLGHVYAREDGWINPDVLLVIADAIKDAAER